MNKVTTLGIDLAKNVFQLHGANIQGKTILRMKVRRSQFLDKIANLPKCIIGIEACAGSHYWKREMEKLGHDVRMIAAQFVKPYVKTNKNDAADAEAICEAVSRPSMRFVPGKTIQQQDMQAIHRIRSRVIRNKTALINEIHGLLHEYGIILPTGKSNFLKYIYEVLDDHDEKLTIKTVSIFKELCEELYALEQRAEYYEKQIKLSAKNNELCQKIMKIEGVGPITASAIVDTIGDLSVFKNGRHFAAWIGIVPKQNSTGGKSVLGRISKRGNTYIRTMLIHGGRSLVMKKSIPKTNKEKWIRRIKDTRGFNKACVAVANKNARIIYALLTSNNEYCMN